jgi:hypothetical protein
MKNQPFILTLFIRVIAFPFFAGLTLVGHLFIYTAQLISFFRYGSETIVYTRNRTRTTIQDVFEELKKMQEDKK